MVDVASRTAGTGVTVELSNTKWASYLAPVDAVVWAQGQNAAGGVLEVTADEMHSMYASNVVFVVETLRALSEAGALSRRARGVVISSIWQIAARSNKVAYVASKAALAGLVPAVAADLAGEEFSMNGVLPGVIETPMTRSQLSAEQVYGVKAATPGGALATPDNVANAVAWLVDPQAAGINGQWITVDNGWSAVRSV